MQLSEAQCGVQSENTRPPAPYLCALQCGWVFWWRQMGGRWVELQRRRRRRRRRRRGMVFVVVVRWSLSWLDIVRWGQRRGRACGARQECGHLISCRGAGDPLKGKANVSARTPTRVLQQIPLAPASLCLADLKLRCRYPVTPTVTELVIEDTFPLSHPLSSLSTEILIDLCDALKMIVHLQRR